MDRGNEARAGGRAAILARGAGIFAALLLFSMMVVATVDVVGRYIFSAPLPGGFELITFSMGLLIYAALPVVTAREEHLTVSVLTHFYVGWKGAARLAVVLAVNIAVLGVMAWRLWIQAISLQQMGAKAMFLGFPIYPFVYAMSVSAAAAAAIQVWLAYRHIAHRSWNLAGSSGEI